MRASLIAVDDMCVPSLRDCMPCALGIFFKKRILFRKEYFYPLEMRGQPNYTNATAVGLNGIPPLHLRVITSGLSPSLATGYFYP